MERTTQERLADKKARRQLQRRGITLRSVETAEGFDATRKVIYMRTHNHDSLGIACGTLKAQAPEIAAILKGRLGNGLAQREYSIRRLIYLAKGELA